jgi:predicted extracellular nuclease
MRSALLATACAAPFAHAAADGLIVSEYVEGSGNNKAVEIWNGGTGAVDLSGYEIRMYFNGSGSPGTTIPLAGTVAPGDVFVLAHAQASEPVLAVADQLSDASWYNGDDAVALAHAGGGALVDVIGRIGFDPGAEWGTGLTSTQDHTLRRRAGVTAGDPDGGNAFDPAAEWEGYAQDAFDGLGAHPGTGVPPVTVAIHDIQGAGHASPLAGTVVRASGIVTAVRANGFHLQAPDAEADDDDATSEAVFVFTETAPAVDAGDAVTVTGTVTEFVPGGPSSHNLATTELTAIDVEVESTGNALPAPVLIGVGGRTPPTQNIDDDGLAVFEPESDAIDFYESLEGMRVRIAGPRAVSARNAFDEIFVVADDGALATGLNDRGGITIAPGDFNPERVQVQLDATLLPGFDPQVTTGDRLGAVTGVVGYAFGNFEVLPTDPFAVTPAGLAREVSPLAPAPGCVTIAAYNVLNLDPRIEDPDRVADPEADVDDDVGDGRFDAIATHIVDHLHAPDVVVLEEIQDGDGAEQTGNTDASLTYGTLIEAIDDAGGPDYEFADVAPADDTSGGQPGGNIRVGMLHRPDRCTRSAPVVSIADPDPADGDAFAGSRRPLHGAFVCNGARIHVIGMHSTSKGGSTPLFGDAQPPVNGGLTRREAQAAAVNAYVDGLLASDPEARIVVVGDMNEFHFGSPYALLAGSPPVLFSLTERLPPAERYTTMFDGNSEDLDQAFVSAALKDRAEYDVVHVNAEFPERASDHDPVLLRLFVAEDGDGDGVPDATDNCLTVANTAQRDTNGDGFGNDCDADFDGNCIVNFLDLAMMKQAFLSPGDDDTDLDGDGVTNFADLARLKAGFFVPPGPSAQAACDPPGGDSR